MRHAGCRCSCDKWRVTRSPTGLRPRSLACTYREPRWWESRHHSRSHLATQSMTVHAGRAGCLDYLPALRHPPCCDAREVKIPVRRTRGMSTRPQARVLCACRCSAATSSACTLTFPVPDDGRSSEGLSVEGACEDTRGREYWAHAPTLHWEGIDCRALRPAVQSKEASRPKGGVRS